MVPFTNHLLPYGSGGAPAVALLSIRPNPVPHLGRIFAVLSCVLSTGQPPVNHPLPEVSCARTEAGHPVDDVHDQVEAVEVVQHDNVEGSGRGALLLVAAHVQVGVIPPAVGKSMDQPG